MARKRSGHPNVVVFLTDQQRWDTTGVHGNPLDLTPNLDRMARRGTHLLQRLHLPAGLRPGAVVLQTGLYATRTAVFRNGIALPRTPGRWRTAFREAGLRHRLHRQVASGRRGTPVPEAQHAAATSTGWPRTCWSSRPTPTTRSCTTATDMPVQLPGYRVDALTDAAIRYVDGHQDRPFFLFLSYLEPHFQNHSDDYLAPNGYRERYAGRWTPPDLAALGGSAHQHLGGYYGMVKRLDEALGRLLDALKSLDLEEDTIVLFTSDHGCHFKTRNAEYKRSCHESSIRVPTALQGPGLDGGGRSANWSAWWTCRRRCWTWPACQCPMICRGAPSCPC